MTGSTVPCWHATSKRIGRLRHEAVGEECLDFAEPVTLEGRAKEQVDAFVTTLAGRLGLIEAASHRAETARVRQAR
ncbi:hypothetical protein [Streptomyces sp. NPDC017991]|uniref:hypothetical protein n=1 Tax=Streptomyces sp. NPDC017991 TaxID=3365026 RepID=UPI0037B0095A